MTDSPIWPVKTESVTDSPMGMLESLDPNIRSGGPKDPNIRSDDP